MSERPASSNSNSSSNEPVVLQTYNLVRRFGGLVATRDVSLTVRRGARHALIGPNGAGKTTLINQLTGVLAPSSGRIELGGRDITALPAHERVGLGLVRTFQINQLWPSLTPLQSLALAVSSRLGASRRWWQALGNDARVMTDCEALLRQFRLEDFAERTTAELPYGKRRLLEIALAVALKPQVLLLDEPAAGVPAGERADILATIAALPADVAVLLIEHDMDLVFSFATRMTVLVNGGVLTEGTPEQIAADPEVRAVYLGESLTGTKHEAPSASTSSSATEAAHG
ncbi:MAG: Lipopolysaccharide export system ATP-binding protein LptB [Pseudomonadota bacterium]|jgi:ABC-type branched-subunit amino acid transport system ATPase component